MDVKSHAAENDAWKTFSAKHFPPEVMRQFILDEGRLSMEELALLLIRESFREGYRAAWDSQAEEA